MTISRFTASVALIFAVSFATGSSPSGEPSQAATIGNTRQTITVRMLGDGTGYRFQPARISAHVGDVVRFINVSGGPHSVNFWADSIPAGAAATLHKNMQSTTGDLDGAMLSGANETFTVSLAGLPVGTYRFYCLPHQAVNMVGRITVRP